MGYMGITRDIISLDEAFSLDDLLPARSPSHFQSLLERRISELDAANDNK